jgi:putative ABC transport system permease protein
VTIVFLIACGNVANLLMARGMRRHAELAIRTALGAGRSRLIRKLLTESACLAGLSGAAGVFVAIAAHPLVRASLPATLPRLDEMRIDLDILAFGLLLSIISGLVFGVVPAFRASRLDAPRSLAGAGRATPDVTRARLRQALVAAQIALATMLLVSAALLLQAFARLQRVPVGFEPDGVLTTRISLPRSAYPDAARTAQFYDRLLTTIEESEQRIEAAIGTSAPFAPGVRAGFQVPVPGRAFSSGAGADEGVAEHIVSGAYFRVLGIPLRAGRVFDAPSTSAPPVAVVSQRFASLVWPDRNPIGQMFERNGRHYAVIGVVGDVRGSDTQGARGGGPDRPPRAAAYFAASQSPQRTMTLLARATGDSAGVIAAIRAAVRQQDAALALQQIRFLDEWRDDSVAPTRLTTGLAASFATIALLLTSVGIYGVLAYTVTSRTREIGVRMAMGATRARVVGLVALEGMTWAAGGIAAGLLGAFAAARLIGTFLFDVPARDPMTFAAAAGAVTLVALAACAIPAARAARIDPTLAMRAE